MGVVEIGSTTHPPLKSEDVVESLLLEEMMRKSMENDSIDALSMRPCHTKERGNYTGGGSKSRGKSKSPGDPKKKLC